MLRNLKKWNHKKWINPIPGSRQGEINLDPLERSLVAHNDRMKNDSELRQKYKHNLTEQIEFWIKEFEATRSERLEKNGRFVFSLIKNLTSLISFTNSASICFINYEYCICNFIHYVLTSVICG